jgi:hypothetical protein
VKPLFKASVAIEIVLAVPVAAHPMDRADVSPLLALVAKDYEPGMLQI